MVNNKLNLSVLIANDDEIIGGVTIERDAKSDVDAVNPIEWIEKFGCVLLGAIRFGGVSRIAVVAARRLNFGAASCENQD